MALRYCILELAYYKNRHIVYWHCHLLYSLLFMIIVLLICITIASAIVTNMDIPICYYIMTISIYVCYEILCTV